MESPPDATRLPPAAAILLLVVVGLALFRTSLASPAAVTDDAWFLHQDVRVRDPAARGRVWSTPLRDAGREGEAAVRGGSYYRPLVLATFGLTFDLAGPDPRAFRLGNLALHLALAIAALLLVDPRRRPLAALGVALLVLTHPLGAEVVSFFAGRFDLLATLLVAGAAFALRDPDAGPGHAAAGALLLLGGLLSKESALPLAPLVLLGARDRRGAALRLCALGGAVAVYATLRIHALGSFLPGGGGALAVGPEEAFRGLFLYAAHLLLPTHPQLLSYPPDAPLALGLPRQVLTAGLLGLLAAGALAALRRGRGLEVATAAGFLVLPLLPVLDPEVLPLPWSDRYLYASLAGLALLLATLARDVLSPRAARRLGIVLLLVAAGNGWNLRGQDAAFRDEEVFWNRLLAQDHVPFLFREHLAELERRRDARTRLGEAHAAGASVEAAVQLGRLGKTAEAERLLASIPADHPDWVRAQVARAAFARRHGDLARARERYAATLAREPGHPPAAAGLGELALRDGDPARALELLDLALARGPHAPWQFNRALTLRALGRLEEAVEALTALVDAHPAEPRYLGARGQLRLELGDEGGREDLAAADARTRDRLREGRRPGAGG